MQLLRWSGSLTTARVCSSGDTLVITATLPERILRALRNASTETDPSRNEMRQLIIELEAALISYCDLCPAAQCGHCPKEEVMKAPPADEYHGILPCPCCGARAEEQEANMPEYEGGSFIECTRCGLTTPVEFDRKENLVAKWNARVVAASVAGATSRDAEGADAALSAAKDANDRRRPEHVMAGAQKKVAESPPPAASHPEDAKRLADIRHNYNMTESRGADVGADVVFMLRLYDAARAEGAK